MELHDIKQLEVTAEEHAKQPAEPYVPRPKWQLALAWILAAIVAFGFLGTCYWLIFFKV